jgi:hypothetical protein
MSRAAPPEKKGPRRQARPEINQQFDDQIEQIVNTRSRRRSQARKSDTVRGELAAETGRKARRCTPAQAAKKGNVIIAADLSKRAYGPPGAFNSRGLRRKCRFGRIHVHREINR